MSSSEPPKRTRGGSKRKSAPPNPKPPQIARVAPPPPPQQFLMRIMNAPTMSKTMLTDQESSFVNKLDLSEATQLHAMLNGTSNTSTEPKRVRVLRSNLPVKVKMDIFKNLAQNESAKYDEWVEHALRIPMGVYSPKPTSDFASFITNARAKMDEEITGHENAKQEILRMICSWLYTDGKTGFAIGLEGEPGVGKTSFAKRALAKCLGRPFSFVGLGGSSDPAALLGHSYTYEGAIPGRLSECMSSAGVMDPIIFFDELDKISHSPKGEDITNALIHLTDPIQNEHIRDRYLHGIDIDFSRAILVFSYNDPSKVHPILLDRIKRIRLKTPTPDEKMAICHKHLIPHAIKSVNPMLPMDLLSPDVVANIVQKNMNEPGMRSIEKDLQHLISSFSLVKTVGTGSILGLKEEDTGDLVPDLSFANAVLSRGHEHKPCHEMMMYL